MRIPSLNLLPDCEVKASGLDFDIYAIHTPVIHDARPFLYTAVRLQHGAWVFSF